MKIYPTVYWKILKENKRKSKETLETYFLWQLGWDYWTKINDEGENTIDKTTKYPQLDFRSIN